MQQIIVYGAWRFKVRFVLLYSIKHVYVTLMTEFSLKFPLEKKHARASAKERL
jgi:hypothetical protein